MPSRTKFIPLIFLVTASLPAATFTYHIAGDEPGPWPQILSSIGLMRAAGGPANLFIVRTVAPGSVPQWLERIEQGGIVVLEGQNELAAALGFKPGDKHVVIRSIVDQRAPKLPIVWESALETPVFELPKEARLLAYERWEHAPVMASVRRGAGAALWIVTEPGKEGYERFPYILQALHDLGVEPPFRSQRLWAFFDGAYRSRVDLDYFAAALARGGDRRAARGRLALLGIESGERCLSAPPDRGLPSAGHPGLRLAGTAARQRKILGRSSGVAREDRPACKTRSWTGANS